MMRRRKEITPQIQFQLQGIFGEFLGTTFYMFFYCISTYVHMDNVDVRNRTESAIFGFFLSSSASFGIGYLSGAHLNPLVTLSVFLLGHIRLLNALCYVGAHLMGMSLGLGISIVVVQQELYSMYNKGMCGFCYPSLNPKLPVMGAFAMEFIATFVFILCVCGTSDRRTYQFRPVNALRFATLNAVMIYTLGPFTGPVLNPFRALIPGIFHGFCFPNLWLYVTACTCGSVTATLLYKYVLRYPPPKKVDMEVPPGPSIHITRLVRQEKRTVQADHVEAPLVIGTF